MPQNGLFVRIGTRGSPLAMVQARIVRRALAQAHGVEEARITIEKITTDGDRSQSSDRPLSEFGGKGVFSSQIEDRLLAGDMRAFHQGHGDSFAVRADHGLFSGPAG
ncbi:MAG: hypothetical protein GXP01_06390 [Alphaproteobacteria bacterium]|nr:hypothetical protein [Alphaproteobacteria bacterium]